MHIKMYLKQESISLQFFTRGTLIRFRKITSTVLEKNYIFYNKKRNTAIKMKD